MKINTALLDAAGVILEEGEFETVKTEIISEVLTGVVSEYSIGNYFFDIEDAAQNMNALLVRA